MVTVGRLDVLILPGIASGARARLASIGAMSGGLSFRMQRRAKFIAGGVAVLAILALARWAPQAFAGVPTVTLVFGGAGFVVVALMAATSSDAAVAWLGRARWTLLHRLGLYYLWFIFAFTYAGQSVAITAVLLAALVLRLRG